MKPITKSLIISSLFAVTTVVGVSAPTAAFAESEAKISIPATADGIWKAVDQEMATLGQLISDKKLATLHEHAYAVRDLIAALPEHAAKLSSDNQAKLASDEKFVAALASRLDQSGDSGDQVGAQSNYEKLSGVLANIEGLVRGAGK